LESELAEFDRRSLKQAIHSAALFTYAKYQPELAPTLEFIKNFNPYEAYIKKKEGAKDEYATWRALLDEYEFTHVDELDKVVMTGVVQGCLDTAALKAVAQEQAKVLHFHDKRDDFARAWDAYHDSFENNADEVLDGLEAASRKAVLVMTPLDLSSVVDLLKDVGRTEQALSLINHYVTSRSEKREFWDLAEHPFAKEITDPDLIAAFKQKFESTKSLINIEEVLERLGRERGWNSEDIEALAGVTSDELYAIFKRKRAIELRRVVKGALNFRDLGIADARMKAVTEAAESALKRIGEESLINARRVGRYGVVHHEAS
jgi:hypothetical protein